MAKHLIVLGHGKGPGSAYDPGATGNGTSEDKFLNHEFLPYLKKYAPSNVDFYTTKNMFALRDANRVSGYDQITELHLDAATGASGGHVIIYKDFKPDGTDKAIRDVVSHYVGLRMPGGFSYRDNLYNLNVFAKRGITYRLIELGFITSSKDMGKIRVNIDGYAKALMAAITGDKVTLQAPKDKGYLAKGDTGSAVKELQRDLNKLGYKLAVDGSFGPAVEKAVKGFQKGNNLAVDGSYGPNTQAKLAEAIKRLEQKPKEEKYMEKNIFVCNSDTDALNAYKACVRNNGVIKFRANAENEKVYAEDTVYICGGGKVGIKVGSGKVVDLSGKNAEETSANIDKHFKLV